MSNHGHRGVLSFRIQISPLCSECPVPCSPPSELSSHALCVSSRSSPFAVSHHQHHRHHPHHHHHHHHHSTCDSFFSTSICHVTLTFASKRVKQRNVGASPCFGWTEIFPSFCQSGDLLAHDVHIDKPKAWCQQKGPGRMSAFALSDPPRPLWYNYLSCHPFSSLIHTLVEVAPISSGKAAGKFCWNLKRQCPRGSKKYGKTMKERGGKGKSSKRKERKGKKKKEKERKWKKRKEQERKRKGKGNKVSEGWRKWTRLTSFVPRSDLIKFVGHVYLETDSGIPQSIHAM